MIRKKHAMNLFQDNTFDWHWWAADIYQTPAELREAFEKLPLVGKHIVDMCSIGGAHNMYGYDLAWKLQIQAERSGVAERFGADPCFYYDPEFTIPRKVQIDEPFVIVFDDGNRLEIDFSEGSSVSLSMNYIPADILPCRGRLIDRDFDAKKYFSPCIGKKLLGFYVKTTSERPDFTGSYGISLDENATEYIMYFDLLLENMKIRFEAYLDYGKITLLNENENPVKITFRELDDCVDGAKKMWTTYKGNRNVGEYLRSYGLMAILDDDSKSLDLIRTTCRRPKILQGYVCQYLCRNYDYTEVSVTVMHRDKYRVIYNNHHSVLGFNVHKRGNCFWRLFVGQKCKCNIDERNPYFFTVMFKDGNGDAILPINILHADVIPSFLEDDYIVMQMVAFAKSVEYIANEDSKNFISADTMSLIPLGVMDSDNSQLVRIKGSIFEVAKRKVSMIGQQAEFLDITVRTPYGMIELVHTLDMVKPEQRHLIKPGNFYNAVCVLSGDVAIGEYKNGAVHDEENFLRLLWNCLDEGDFYRFYDVVSDICKFAFEDGRVIKGRGEVSKYFDEHYGGKCTKACLPIIYKDGMSRKAVKVMTDKPLILLLDVHDKKIEMIRAYSDMSIKQSIMDDIEFQVFEEGPYENDIILSHRAKFVRTLINGYSILEYVKEYEQRTYFDGTSVGNYMYQFADELYRCLTDKEYRIDDEIGLLICGGCLDEGCWPVFVKMDEKSDVITWSDFYNPFTCYDSTDEHIKPFDIGPFHFAREDFEKAVKELGEQLSS